MIDIDIDIDAMGSTGTHDMDTYFAQLLNMFAEICTSICRQKNVANETE